MEGKLNAHVKGAYSVKQSIRFWLLQILKWSCIGLDFYNCCVISIWYVQSTCPAIHTYSWLYLCILTWLLYLLTASPMPVPSRRRSRSSVSESPPMKAISASPLSGQVFASPPVSMMGPAARILPFIWCGYVILKIILLCHAGMENCLIYPLHL
jgi:hypothetical protein